MSMAAGGNEGLNNEINVTPMIDVLLVLLIIFMAALPSMRKAIDLQLPVPNPAVATANENSDQIVLEVFPGEKYSINTKPVTGNDSLAAELTRIYAPRNEKIIYVKGDPTLKYQDVIKAMDIARGSGVKIIGVPPRDTPGGTEAAATTG